MSTETPRVLFVCVKNGGKSQMAAALFRHRVGDRAIVESAGTEPGTSLNQQSADSVAQVGASMAGEHPKQLTNAMLQAATRVIVIGTEAQVVPVPGMHAAIEVWETDEPSTRGIEGAERMALIRDDIAARVDALATELGID